MSARSSLPIPSVPASSPALLQALGHPLADRRLQVLRALQGCGSISQAARQVGVSYKAAWQALDTLGNLAGVPVVAKSVGGAGGGGATLTPAGHELLRAADALAQARGAVAQQLQAGPALPHWGLQTSMRNQWPCEVVAVERSGPLARVQLRSQTGGTAVHARITAESAQLLGLAAGTPVLALCKATAVQVLAASAPVPATAWPARVARVAAGAIGDEVAVRTEAGVHLVGFAEPQTGWRAGRKVWVVVPESAVVLALAG